MVSKRSIERAGEAYKGLSEKWHQSIKTITKSSSAINSFVTCLSSSYLSIKTKQTSNRFSTSVVDKLPVIHRDTAHMGLSFDLSIISFNTNTKSPFHYFLSCSSFDRNKFLSPKIPSKLNSNFSIYLLFTDGRPTHQIKSFGYGIWNYIGLEVPSTTNFSLLSLFAFPARYDRKGKLCGGIIHDLVIGAVWNSINQVFIKGIVFTGVCVCV